MKKKTMVTAAALMAALCVTAAAAEPGSGKDPLITLSYLEDVFYEQVLEAVDKRIEERNEDIAKAVTGTTGTAGTTGENANETFAVVTLSKGQTLIGDIGCEVMLRVGTANCVAPSIPGLIDETGAVNLNNGSALQKNHMYMITVEERGLVATSETVKVLLRGGYTLQ